MADMVLLLSLLTFLTGWSMPELQRNVPGTNDFLTLDGARPVIDNQRATVWDLTWTKGVPEAMERSSSNSVWISVAPMPGHVVYWPKGAARQALQSPDSPAHTVVIDLKDHAAATLENKSRFPNAFPRPGSRKVLENDRIVVWDYTWTAGQATPMHFHDKDVVVVYLKDGALKSTTPDGQSVVNKLTVGKTTFNASDRVHTETLVEGESRAIITEFK
jgi:hypothetical protein